MFEGQSQLLDRAGRGDECLGAYHRVQAGPQNALEACLWPCQHPDMVTTEEGGSRAGVRG